MLKSQSSDAMNNLVKFMIILSIAGTIVAFLVTFMIAQSQDAALIVPMNKCRHFCSTSGCMWFC